MSWFYGLYVGIMVYGKNAFWIPGILFLYCSTLRGHREKSSCCHITSLVSSCFFFFSAFIDSDWAIKFHDKLWGQCGARSQNWGERWLTAMRQSRRGWWVRKWGGRWVCVVVCGVGGKELKNNSTELTGERFLVLLQSLYSNYFCQRC